MKLPGISFGQLRLTTPLLLSPLAGYTNLPFRRVIRELGSVGLCTTDLVNARSLLEKNHKALKLIETCAEDTPLAVQLFGSVAQEMRDAARTLEQLGVASVDINMGCPGEEGLPGRRRLGHDDGAGHDVGAGARDGGGGEDSGDMQDAPGLG